MTTEERAHLVHLLKLSIKVLLQSALSLGRSLDAEHAPLQQFFVVLEHCLKHGLKGETGTPPPAAESPAEERYSDPRSAAVCAANQ